MTLGHDVYAELASKAAADDLDYELDLSDVILGTAHLDAESVIIEDAGNGESPLALSVHDVEAVTPEGGDRTTAVRFWLAGGSAGVRYQGKVTISDNASSSPDRAGPTKRFFIEVRP